MSILDSTQTIEKIDQGDMRRVLEGFPEQCRQAFELAQGFSVAKNFAGVKNIVFCGMGGSAIGAELVSFYLRNEIKLPVIVNREYSLPAFVDEHSLVIFSSYSGNTEETLSAYSDALARKAKIVALTSGGSLAESAASHGVDCLLVPQGFPPRGALGYMCLPLLSLLTKARLIQDKEAEINETILLLERLKKELFGIDIKTELNPAKQLAQKSYNKFCVIYAGSEHLGGVVTRWRGQLAENSKMLSSSHVLPEMNHNEIVGWQYPQALLKDFEVIILRDKEEHPQVKKRIEISKELLQKDGVSIEEISSKGAGLLARVFSLIYLGDFVSFYLAILNKEDPTPVKRVEYLKKRLKEM